MWRIFVLFLAGGSAALAAAGCNSKTETAVPESSRNLKMLDVSYKKATAKLGHPPANLAELLPYLKEAGEPDQILRSPDDGEEYVIHWGANPNANPAVVLAYEKNGKSGKRYVLRGKAVFSMNDEEFKKAPFPPGRSAP